MRFVLLFIALLTRSFWVMAQDILPELASTRTNQSPKIDGIISDSCWKNLPIASNFTVSEPVYGTKPAAATEVKILYDNRAIYVCAKLYDLHPDSISHELGKRDDNVNSDFFSVTFDTYNNRQDAFVFGVYASGVQKDYKINDLFYDAVWESAAQLNDSGWTVELKIPYSAIRFPSIAIQDWGLNFGREVYRSKELQEWALIPRNISNKLLKCGSLTGIENIKTPLRLSITPYLSGLVAHSPSYKNDGSIDSYGISYSYGAGADIKYGINDRFTFDLTLLPDFNQVQSDNKIKNLTPFEVKYDENRFFFKESADLFSKGSIFYSRRIGKIPGAYFSVEDSLKPGETLEKNPSTVGLINAAKISGRTDKGLGIGIINAVTRSEFATLRDSLGNERKVLTEPLANYNMLVFDQQFKNNSSFYISNANTIRNGKYDDSNVSAAGLVLTNQKNNYEITARGGLSQRFTLSDDSIPTKTSSFGYKYHYGIEKVSGNFVFLAERNVISDTYFPGDLGIQSNFDFVNNGVLVGYIFYVPKGIYRTWSNKLKVDYSYSFRTNKNTESYYNFVSEMLLQNLWTINFESGFTPNKNANYFESRIDEQVYMMPREYYSHLQIMTNNRKRLVLTGGFVYGNYFSAPVNNPQYETDAIVYFRQSNKLSFSYTFRHVLHKNNLGFSKLDDEGNPLFGSRERTTISNLFNTRYTFKLNMSIDLKVRHYWDKAVYNRHYHLNENGSLSYIKDDTNYTNFNYNVFNIDLVYTWIFAPGSNLSIVYKNNSENESGYIYNNYGTNLRNTFGAPQTNSISLKLLYYIDYLYFVKK